ncbi:TonB-dependent receptor [Marivirga tractuosa]|uniref:hypothetical protein n=1 Tax=Marivirga tractuosa TaxID=1006 RepID=UPI0035CEAC7F
MVKSFFKVFLVLFFAVTSKVYGQVEVSGKLLNELSNPIPYATVQLQDSLDQNLAYSLSDEEGVFQLQFNYYGCAYLIINHLNYDGRNDTICLDKSSNKYFRKYVLTTKENKLQEVLVSGTKQEARKSGDSIHYDLELQKTGAEKNLGELINKMPGLDVDDEGNVLANGKKIDRLMVDGKDFFGDNHRMATENLNPEMVNGLTLINNYKSNNMLSDQSGSQGKALNIDLKDDYSGKWIGDLSLLGAYQKRYSADFNTYYFGKSFSFSLFNNANNTGERQFSLQEYVKMNLNGQKELFSSNLSAFSSLNEIPEFLQSSSVPNQKQSQFSAVNYLYEVNEKLKIQGYSLLNHGREGFKEITQKRLIGANETFSFSDTTERNTDYLFARNSINLHYQVNKNYQLDYQLNFNPSNVQLGESISAEAIASERQLIKNDFAKEQYNLQQQLNQLIRLDDQNFIGLTTHHKTQNNQQYTNLESNQLLFSTDTNNITNPLYSRKSGLEQALYYAHYFDNSRFLLTTDGKYDNNRLENLFSIDSVSDYELNYRTYRFSQAAEWLKTSGDWQYQLALQWQHILFEDRTEKQNSDFWFPKIKLKYAFNSTHYVSVNYDNSIKAPSIDQLNRGVAINDYRNLQVGSSIRYSEMIKQSQWGLNYFNFDLFNNLLFFINTTYKYNAETFVKDIRNQLTYNELGYALGAQSQEWVNLAHIEWRIPHAQHKVKSQLSWSQFENPVQLNNDKTFTNSVQQKASFSIWSQFKNKIINYETGIKYENNQYQFGKEGERNEIRTIDPYISLKGSWNNQLNYRSQLLYRKFQQSDFNRYLWQWDFNIEYSFSDSWSLFLKGKDILNLSNSTLLKVQNTQNILATTIHHRLNGYISIGLDFQWK